MIIIDSNTVLGTRKTICRHIVRLHYYDEVPPSLWLSKLQLGRRWALNLFVLMETWWQYENYKEKDMCHTRNWTIDLTTVRILTNQYIKMIR